MATANNRVMTDATGQEILSALQNLAAVQAVPYVASIPTGQWSGSENDWYITINASNVTANSILIPNYDKDSSELLNGPVWCVPAAGSFTIHTSAIPAGTVTIMVMFAGTMGEAQYQVLADVYSTSQALAKADVVNNLSSTATDKPLSAAQGKALNDNLNNIPRIKTTTVTGTTNGAGNLLYNTFTGEKIIGAESNNSIVLYFLSGGYYYFKVLSWDDMSPKANASVTINVVYY